MTHPPLMIHPVKTHAVMTHPLMPLMTHPLITHPLLTHPLTPSLVYLPRRFSLFLDPGGAMVLYGGIK